MTKHHNHWKEETPRSCRALLDDINAKLGYAIQLLREQRDSACRYPYNGNGHGGDACKSDSE